jgi:cell division protein FtsN
MATKRGKQAYRGGERRSLPAWMWLGLGTLFGVVLSVVVLYGGKLPTLRGKNLPQPNPDATAPKESEQALADEAKKVPAPPKSNFDFYNVLPEKEVVIPDAELSAKAKAEQARAQQAAQANGAATPATPVAGSAPATTAGGHYMLQVLATSDAKAAEEFKARVALLGFSAKVYGNSPDGKIRVRLGPYATASETEAAKRSLADNNINSFPISDAPAH